MPGCEDVTHYELLGVSPDAGAEEIRHAYRRMARLTHPDVEQGYGGSLRFHRVLRAYQVLSDPVERRHYDTVMGIGSYGADRQFYADSFARMFGRLFGGLNAVMTEANDKLRNFRDDCQQRRAG
jgi:molecular chaperone DnaJ